MPLKQGSSDDDIGENIKRLMHEGKPQDQAIAIAYSEAGRSEKEAEAAIARAHAAEKVLGGARAMVAELKKYSEDQARDANGQWAGDTTEANMANNHLHEARTAAQRGDNQAARNHLSRAKDALWRLHDSNHQSARRARAAVDMAASNVSSGFSGMTKDFGIEDARGHLSDYMDRTNVAMVGKSAELKKYSEDQSRDDHGMWSGGGSDKARAMVADLKKYSEDQERDDSGRWVSGGGQTPGNYASTPREFHQRNYEGTIGGLTQHKDEFNQMSQRDMRSHLDHEHPQGKGHLPALKSSLILEHSTLHGYSKADAKFHASYYGKEADLTKHSTEDKGSHHLGQQRGIDGTFGNHDKRKVNGHTAACPCRACCD